MKRMQNINEYQEFFFMLIEKTGNVGEKRNPKQNIQYLKKKEINFIKGLKYNVQ